MILKAIKRFTSFNAILLLVLLGVGVFVGLGWGIVESFNDKNWFVLALLSYFGLNLVACTIEVGYELFMRIEKWVRDCSSE